MPQHPYIAIALAADLHYTEQVQTLIKSVCNRHQNVRFYLFNKDYPIEWFHSLNNQLEKINCQILDVKVQYDWLDQYTTLGHITEATFYRYLIPQLPEKRILYLDSDIVVDTSLVDLYYMNLHGHFLAAAPDMLMNHLEHWYTDFPNMKPYFNAGLMLVDNDKWIEHNVQHDLFTLTNNYKVMYGDQDILNMYFHGKWLMLNPAYNYQTGSLPSLRRRNLNEAADTAEELAKQAQIIHYTTARKPWLIKPERETPIILRDKYWQFQRMQWHDIIAKHKGENNK